MSDYPDIEREVPAWIPRPRSDNDPVCPMDNPRWLTGLAQFVRAIQRPLEERIAALERQMKETGPWPEDFPYSKETLETAIRATARERWMKELIQDTVGEMAGEGYFNSAPVFAPYQKPAPPPDLAERLAREGAKRIWSDAPANQEWAYGSLLPIFQRAVRGEG